MTIICATGHRPQKLQDNWGQYSSLTLPRLTKLAAKYFELTQPEVVISGMALGWDTAVALAAIKQGIKLHAYVPFNGHHARWKQDSQDTFHLILSKATVVSYPKGEDVKRLRTSLEVSKLLMNRNTDMLNASDRVVALWNGDNKGGTADAIRKAKRMRLQVDNLWKSWVKYKGF